MCIRDRLLNGSAMKPGELGRSCGLSSGGVTVVLDRLEKAGYIRRDANPDDRRSVIVRPEPGPVRKLEAIYRSKAVSYTHLLVAALALAPAVMAITLASAPNSKLPDSNSSRARLSSKKMISLYALPPA